MSKFYQLKNSKPSKIHIIMVVLFLNLKRVLMKILINQGQELHKIKN